MKIVIFAGGSGSVELQRGLYRALEQKFDGIETQVIVNAYDNGLSTGAVRRVMDGRILGPSDVRKNQATRLRLINPDTPWIGFLDHRFTASAAQAHRACYDEATKLCNKLKNSDQSTANTDLIFAAIDEYFRAPKAKRTTYDDFSLANIVYAGVAHQNGDSLRAAARIMAELLSIPDCVLLNDDRSLFLGATTRSGVRVTDEGDIVAWNNAADPFVDLFFEDAEGKAAMPYLGLEAWQAIVAADLIVLSSGTQWSSLIPTYASIGFKEAIRASQARVVMVMNRAPDKDNIGRNASDIVATLVPRYFDPGQLHVLLDAHGHPTLRSLDESVIDKIASQTQAELSLPAEPADKHNPAKLAEAIGQVVFREFLDSDLFLFDYDDTLCGRKGQLPKSSRFNVDAVARLNNVANVALCTGNTIRSVNLNRETDESRKPLRIFADGGVNLYSSDDYRTFSSCVAPADVLLATAGPHAANEIIGHLQAAGIPASHIDNRGGAVIAIKPVPREQRTALMCMARSIVDGTDLVVRESGTTTIEIRGRRLSKLYALEYLFGQPSAPARITYVGDECDFGNDAEISQLAQQDTRVACLRVPGPAMTAFFIATLLKHLEQDA